MSSSYCRRKTCWPSSKTVLTTLKSAKLSVSLTGLFAFDRATAPSMPRTTTRGSLDQRSMSRMVCLTSRLRILKPIILSQRRWRRSYQPFSVTMAGSGLWRQDGCVPSRTDARLSMTHLSATWYPNMLRLMWSLTIRYHSRSKTSCPLMA